MENIRYILENREFCERLDVRVANGAVWIKVIPIEAIDGVMNSCVKLSKVELNELISYLTQCRDYLLRENIESNTLIINRNGKEIR